MGRIRRVSWKQLRSSTGAQRRAGSDVARATVRVEQLEDLSKSDTNDTRSNKSRYVTLARLFHAR